MRKITKSLLLAVVAMSSSAWADSFNEENISNMISRIFAREVTTAEEAMSSFEVTRDASELREEVTQLSSTLVDIMNESETDLRSALDKLDLMIDGKSFPTLFPAIYDKAKAVWEMIVNMVNELHEKISNIYSSDQAETNDEVATEVIENEEVAVEETTEAVTEETVVENEEIVSEPAVEEVVAEEVSEESVVEETESSEEVAQEINVEENDELIVEPTE